jgi:hypothetical protein
MISSSLSPSSAPSWADASSASKRPAPIEDPHGTSSSPESAGTAMVDDDEVLLAPVSTLDEPVSETIMRDVRAVGAKLRAVLIPLDRSVSGAFYFIFVRGLRCLLKKHTIHYHRTRRPT